MKPLTKSMIRAMRRLAEGPTYITAKGTRDALAARGLASTYPVSVTGCTMVLTPRGEAWVEGFYAGAYHAGMTGDTK